MYFNLIFSTAFFTLFILGLYLSANLIIKAFALKNRFLKISIYFTPFLILVLFFTSFALASNYQNNFLAYFYIIFGLLFALLSQLMLFGFFYYLIFLFLKRKKSIQVLAKIFLSLAFVSFLLGVYNAFNFEVKVIDLSHRFTAQTNIVHLTDLHLGYIYGPGYLEKLVSRVNHLEADLIVISGDLFDGSDKEIDKFVVSLQKFKSPVIFIFGNHDVYSGFKDKVSEVVKEAGLIELKDEALLINNLEIIGFDYLSNSDSNLRREIKNLLAQKEYPRIVVNHVPVDYREAHALGADLMLAGHTHRGQVFPLSLITRLIYGQFAYGLSNYQEMLFYTSAGVGTWGPPIRTPFRGEISLISL